MPAFAADKGGPLTDAQVKVLAAGIKPRWGASLTGVVIRCPLIPLRHGSAGGDKSRGAKVFARACASCHGPLGEGGENSDGGAGAINDPAFLALDQRSGPAPLCDHGAARPGYARLCRHKRAPGRLSADDERRDRRSCRSPGLVEARGSVLLLRMGPMTNGTVSRSDSPARSRLPSGVVRFFGG